MKLVYDLFLTDTETITEVMTEFSNTIRVDNVDEEDVCSFCELADKYGFTIAAFLRVSEE